MPCIHSRESSFRQCCRRHVETTHVPAAPRSPSLRRQILQRSIDTSVLLKLDEKLDESSYRQWDTARARRYLQVAWARYMGNSPAVAAASRELFDPNTSTVPLLLREPRVQRSISNAMAAQTLCNSTIDDHMAAFEDQGEDEPTAREEAMAAVVRRNEKERQMWRTLVHAHVLHHARCQHAYLSNVALLDWGRQDVVLFHHPSIRDTLLALDVDIARNEQWEVSPPRARLRVRQVFIAHRPECGGGQDSEKKLCVTLLPSSPTPLSGVLVPTETTVDSTHLWLPRSTYLVVNNLACRQVAQLRKHMCTATSADANAPTHLTLQHPHRDGEFLLGPWLQSSMQTAPQVGAQHEP